jgi:hypothetical protein
MIPGVSEKLYKDGVGKSYKLKTQVASFNLKPVPGKIETYLVQVTPRDLGGIFKNSGALWEGAKDNSTNSTFGPFIVQRRPGLNAVSRSANCGPIAGNAVLMWPNIAEIDKVRLFDQLDKIIRNNIPKIELKK